MYNLSFLRAPEPPRRILGNREGQSARIKAVQVDRRPTSWHLFVGRLEPDNSVNDVTEFLSEEGIEVLKCTALVPKAEWQKKFAAFHIVINDMDKDKVFDCVAWPKGADVRDWVFRRNGQS